MSSHAHSGELIKGINLLWFCKDEQWVKLVTNFKNYAHMDREQMLEQVLDDVQYHCHEAIFLRRPYGNFQYVVIDFASVRSYLESKNLLELPCLERGISFDAFPDIFSLPSTRTRYQSSGDRNVGFPNAQTLRHIKQYSLNSISLIRAVFGIEMDQDFDKGHIHFYAYQALKPTSHPFAGALLVFSAKTCLYFFNGE